MLTEQMNYYVSTATQVPYVETVKTNPAGKVVSVTNAMKPGDTPTTKQFYDNYLASMEQLYNQEMLNISMAKQQEVAQKVADKTAATPALLAIGLTQQQIDSIFGV